MRCHEAPAFPAMRRRSIVAALVPVLALLMAAAEEIGQKLESAGFSVLMDDRDERAGVKFKDADLVGIPYRINVGKKVTEGKVEVVSRSTRKSEDANIPGIDTTLKQLVRS